MRKVAHILFPMIWMLVSCEFFGVKNEPDLPTNENDSTLVGDSAVTDSTENNVIVCDTARNPAYLYDMLAIPEITLTITEKNWNQYLSNFDHNPDNSEHIPVAFTFKKNGQTFYRDSVGLRPRGNTSRRRPEGNVGEVHRKNGAEWHHTHFGIRFTKYVTGQRFFGSDRITLKWFNNDPTYVREIYSYDLFHRFNVWSAPRASYCRLYLYVEGDTKPAYFGVYAMIEDIRKGYLADRRKDGFLPDENGNLWKARWTDMGGANLEYADLSKMGASDDNHEYPYDLKTNEKTALDAAKAELANFINGMKPLPSGSAELKAWLEQNMDVDLFLRAQAVNVMVGMWDDYWVNQNNYYFYFDENSRFYFIPYDYDNTLGTSNNINPGTQDPLHWGSRGGDRLLIKKVLSIPQFENQYKAYLQALAAGDFAYAASKARIEAWQAMIRPYVANDTGEDMVIEDKTAAWSIYSGYRLLSGGIGDGKSGEANFFLTKINSVPK